ncbi:nuclease-related domain-containing protein [Ornithinibacillus bavariensis]|uniref:nuclease-related domain-containing protein n=1 Tax=Ornithinibacillus bavariensis TaxID=545502 RepID=UPI000EE86BFE|nr:hypothetical protein [Ornithinibacillus sp.]
MIVKHRIKPKELYKLEAAVRRVTQTHPYYERLQMDLKRKRRQITGEKEVDYPLRFLEEKENLILHDLRLKDEQGYFQIDSLIICKKYCLILEMKNWYGTILFDENNQVIRIGDDGKEEGFPNPIPQAQLQQYRLKKWLYKIGITAHPVEYLVVISFPSTIIKATPKSKIPERVVHSKQLIFHIHKLDNLYTPTTITIRKLTNVAKRLVEAHQESDRNFFDSYRVTINDLIRGVFCPECSYVPMIREHQKWVCSKCGFQSTDAHIQALSDYSYLISSTITNKAAREFLQVSSPHVVKRLLQQGGYEQIGINKGRKYRLDSLRIQNR